MKNKIGVGMFATLVAVGLIYGQGMLSRQGMLSDRSGTNDLVTEWQKYRAKHRTDNGVVVQLTIRSDEFGDEQCQKLAELDQIKILDLSGTSITDASLKVIGQLASLQTLRLDETRVTSTGLAALRNLEQLNELSLVKCKLGEITTEGLGALRSLRSLNLIESDFSNPGIAALADLKALRQLYLGRTRLTSASLSGLVDFAQLRLVNLAGIKCDSASDFGVLGELSALELLYLDDAEFSDAAFAAFASRCRETGSLVSAVFLENCQLTDASHDALLEFVKLPSLTKLRLTGTSLTREVFNEIAGSTGEVSFAFAARGQVVED